jgi:hypothetical protein
MIMISDRHHLGQQTAFADDDLLVCRQRAVVTKDGALTDLETPTGFDGDTSVEDATRPELGHCPVGHQERSAPADVASGAKFNSRIADSRHRKAQPSPHRSEQSFPKPELTSHPGVSRRAAWRADGVVGHTPTLSVAIELAMDARVTLMPVRC